MSRQSIVAEVLAEREAQDRQFGARVDDAHRANDWIAIAARHLGLASSDMAESDPARWRRQFVRLAAVAMAAVEAHDRQGSRLDPIALICQATADRHGEPVLLLKAGDPNLEYPMRTPYGVLLSQSSPWERANTVRTVTPSKGEPS